VERGPDRRAHWSPDSATARRGTATASSRTRRLSFVPPLPGFLLGGARDPVDDRVDEPRSLALDLHHVDVGDHLLVAVEPNRAARRGDRRGGVSGVFSQRAALA